MPRCSGCGTELPTNARFCSICGAQVSNPAATPTLNPGRPAAAAYSGVADDATAGRSKIGWAIGGAVLIVALAGFLFAKASGLLSANKTAAPTAAVLNAPPTNPVSAPILNVPPVAAPRTTAPVLQAPTAAGNPMPEDVIAYLRWLKQFEAARRELKARSDAQYMLVMTNMMVNPLKELTKDPDEQKKTISSFSQKDKTDIFQTIAQWNNVAGLFQRKTPPNPCASLALAYNGMLTTIVSQEAKIQQIFEQIDKLSSGDSAGAPDPQAMLSSLMSENNNKSMSHAADATFTSSDDALNAVRDRYTNIPQDIDKAHFDIRDQSNVRVPAPPGSIGM